MGRRERIAERLNLVFSPIFIEVLDESHHHSAGKETHFNVVLVSEKFIGQRVVLRHRQVFAELNSELAGGMHALSLKLLTPEEAEANGLSNPQPACLGGSKAENRG